MGRTVRRLPGLRVSASVMIALTVLPGCSSTATQSGKAPRDSSTSTHPGVHRCRARQLVASFRPIGAAAGAASAAIQLSNHSASECRLKGYVSVVLQAADRVTLATHVIRGSVGEGVFPDPGPGPIDLKPHSSSVFGIGWDDNPVQAGSRRTHCRPSYYLLVGLPGDQGRLDVPTGSSRTQPPIRPCGGAVTITAIQRGTTLRRN